MKELPQWSMLKFFKENAVVR
uniref:Uncharacterized protein n=1 Tax=Plectus sambesii TaxID=2011161 RepID=A0A914X8Z0_9BILA